jgi:tellurite resistance protein TehA-like permease
MLLADIGIYQAVSYPVGLMVAGLLICYLSESARYTVLKILFWWAGIVFACLGLLIVLINIFAYIARVLSNATGAGGGGVVGGT